MMCCTGEDISDVKDWNCERYLDQSALWLLVEKEFSNILKLLDMCGGMDPPIWHRQRSKSLTHFKLLNTL